MDDVNFDMNVDIRKLAEQNPEFAAYAGKSLLAIFTQTKAMMPVVAALYGFYNIGMSEDQIVKWWRTIQPFNPPTKE